MDHDEIAAEMKRAMKGTRNLRLPPESFIVMDGRFETYTRKKKMVCSFYANPKFSNPAHVMQGGFLAAAIDNTMGPLSYLAAGRPTTTLELGVNYIRKLVARATSQVLILPLRK